MSDERPAWADAEVLSVCSPELHGRCDWPDCAAFARHEVEFDVDGSWAVHQLCPDHGSTVAAGDGEP